MGLRIEILLYLCDSVFVGDGALDVPCTSPEERWEGDRDEVVVEGADPIPPTFSVGEGSPLPMT